ncbi:hypothetical protein PN36_06830 [Candidatus Thiomargarita nelsonii]|uniref:Peptidase M28 n=1 Tax=Candidatus Thiomargarita nelsonii TaxID=1003181 RepID=A0A4E0QRM9_9GAMM|nr:hypothetical protein PN36_06830 [Candidatus Thiomargarita nelsonii]
MSIRWVFVTFFVCNVMASEPVKDHREIHLQNVQQLTFGGENAEAYFSFDGTQLVFQATPRHQGCDQIFVMNVDGGAKRLLSTGKGRTTCSFFYPDGQHILYASTHDGSVECPPPVDMSQGYVWALYPDYDIYKADMAGNIVQKLTDTPGYDAEAVLSPRGDKIVFTSTRSGDLELWSMDLAGANLKQLTNTPGYDGGAFFSPDGSKIVWRASRFDNNPQGLADYQRLLKEDMIRPSQLEIFVMDVDGSNQQQVTHLGKASFGPYFHPSGEKIIFSSNVDAQREFDLYMINIDGSGLERITYTAQFDGFPMFSLDGKKLVWGSNRNNAFPRETNIFIADWVDDVREIVPEVSHYHQSSEIKAEDLFHHVRFLADDRLRGRFPGSDGIEYAARYIADRFAEYGLDSYFQVFEYKDELGKTINTRNVVGFLPGKTDKTIIIGAHYDHLGGVHNGADDNASGVAGVLELAQFFGSHPVEHSLLFIAFSGEELGLIGSKYYVNHPLKEVVAMINMDMIGHLRENKLIIQGVGTSPVWEEIVDKVNESYSFVLAKQKEEPGTSDQRSFYEKQIAVLGFLTGAHDHYNRSTDDFWRLNYPGHEKIVKFVRDVVIDLRADQVTFSALKVNKKRAKFKVSLGVMPDYAFTSQGLRLDAVKVNRSAYNAGLQSGDIIIKLGAVQINDIYDYVAALGTFEVGDKVELVFLRDGLENSVEVLLVK